MADMNALLKRMLPVISIGAVVIGVCGALFWLVYNAMQEPPPKSKKVVTQVNIVRPPPPPPPPEDMPEPEIEEEVEVVEEEEAAPEPDLADIPDGPLGLDADGAAGMDGFGLAARKGGVDITALGGDPYGWYRDVLRNDLAARLAEFEQIRRSSYEVKLRMWLDRDGRVKRIALVGSTGNRELDNELERAFASLQRVAEPPPPGMGNPVRLRIASRT